VERTGLLRVQVQRGDSWWKLAEQYLGSGTRWQELRELNGELLGAPDLLKSDSIVVVPESVRRSKTSPPQSITAKKGDTLWALAREHLGRGSAWTCLAQINPEVVDYTHLKIGTPILLPADGALDSCQGGIVHTTRK
jgi:nucleoid-associated protein YgaU